MAWVFFGGTESPLQTRFAPIFAANRLNYTRRIHVERDERYFNPVAVFLSSFAISPQRNQNQNGNSREIFRENSNTTQKN